MDNKLQRIIAGSRQLEKAKTVPEAKLIRDQAKAIAIYLKEQGYSLKCRLDASELQLRAERKIGCLIPNQFPKGHLNGKDKNGNILHKSHHVTCEEVGIGKMQSSRWQSQRSFLA